MTPEDAIKRYCERMGEALCIVQGGKFSAGLKPGGKEIESRLTVRGEGRVKEKNPVRWMDKRTTVDVENMVMGMCRLLLGKWHEELYRRGKRGERAW